MQAEESKKVESLIGLQSAIKFNGGGVANAAIIYHACMHVIRLQAFTERCTPGLQGTSTTASSGRISRRRRCRLLSTALACTHACMRPQKRK